MDLNARLRFDHELLALEHEHDVSCMLELTRRPHRSAWRDDLSPRQANRRIMTRDLGRSWSSGSDAGRRCASPISLGNQAIAVAIHRGQVTVGEFERACTESERAAAAAAKAAAGVARAAKHLEKAAHDGDIAKIRKAADALKSAEETARQEAHNAQVAWPFTPAQEMALLEERYEKELLATAVERGLKISRQDDRLVVYPSIVRLLPEARAVQVDRTKVTSLRPSILVEQLRANQSKKPRFRPEQFLESLYRAYKLVVGPDGVQGTTLDAVYQALTLLPGASKEYVKPDFARDIYFLQSSNVNTTRSGARVGFPASTGTRGASKLFTFVGPDGRPVVYYGITFTEGRT